MTFAAEAVPGEPCVKVTVAWALPAVAVPMVGALGGTPITSDGLDDDGADSTPFTEIDVTVKVTVLPAVRPVTTIGLEEPVAVCPELAVALYVIVPLPTYVGAVKTTDADVPDASNGVPIVGTPGILPPESLGVLVIN